MLSAEGDLVLVFNGEIFNYVELRGLLQARGHIFHSTGDTEVLLAAYREWGQSCVERFVGMFAFAVFDKRHGHLFLARDRFGVKPLYLLNTPRGLAFGSEIKALRASGWWDGRLNEERFASLLVHQRVDALREGTGTFLQGIEQLPAAQTLCIDLAGRRQSRTYWQLPTAEERTAPADPPGAFLAAFEDAMRLTMRADVPVGVMLSGGMDSSSIACEMARIVGDAAQRRAPLHAFCYESRAHDESQQLADTVAQTGATVHRYRPQGDDVWRDLSMALWHHDEPLHSASVLAGFGLYRMAAAQGVRVVLGGQGADETMAGYPVYFESALVSHLLQGHLGTYWAELSALSTHGFGSRGHMVRRSLLGLRGHGLLRLSQGYRAAAAKRRLAEADGWPYVDAAFGKLVQPQEQFRGADLHTMLAASTTLAPLPCYLRAEDRNASAHSIEARVPLLDHRLVELCMKLPVKWKMRDGWNKYVFREAMRARIPESVRGRRVKFGFPTDVNTWFTGRAAAAARERVLDGPLRQRGWVQMGPLDQAFSEHAAGRRDHSDLLFNVVQLSHWLAMHDEGWARPAKVPAGEELATTAD